MHQVLAVLLSAMNDRCLLRDDRMPEDRFYPRYELWNTDSFAELGPDWQVRAPSSLSLSRSLFLLSLFLLSLSSYSLSSYSLSLLTLSSLHLPHFALPSTPLPHFPLPSTPLPHFTPLPCFLQFTDRIQLMHLPYSRANHKPMKTFTPRKSQLLSLSHVFSNSQTGFNLVQLQYRRVNQ